jgi:hypothetical protein
MTPIGNGRSWAHSAIACWFTVTNLPLNSARAPMTSDSGAERKFWQIAFADLERQLGAGRNGLSSAEAAARRLRYGPNTLEERRRLSLPLKFLSRFRNPLFGVQAHLFGDLWPHTGRFDGENRRLGGRQRHPVTNSYVLRIEGHGVKAPVAQRRRHLIDALIGRNMRTRCSTRARPASTSSRRFRRSWRCSPAIARGSMPI